MKVYVLKESDFEELLAAIDRDPAHGIRGGSSTVISEEERHIYVRVHRFYNYQVRSWIDKHKANP